jgi:hypothetical protein
MPPVQPQDEQGLMQLVFSSIMKRLRSGLLRRRKPQFGVPLPKDPSFVAEPVPAAQLPLHFDSESATTTTPAAPAPTPVEPAQAVVDTRVPADAPPGSVPRMTGTPSTPWSMPSLTRTFVVDGLTWALGVVILVIVGVRFWRYEDIQAEMYGDIEIVQTYVRAVLAGSMPWYFIESSGPLYHYLIAPLLALIGDDYGQIKIASILVSFAVLGFVYAFARRYEGRLFALLALGIAGTGSWLLVFSRLGNSQIFVPLVAMATVFLLYRFIQSRNDRWLYASAVVASCGLYAYPQSYIIPPVMLLTVVMLWRTGVIVQRSSMAKYAAGLGVGSIPFVVMFIANPASVFGPYITEKFASGEGSIESLPLMVARGIGAYFVAGDPWPRGNPQGLAHLDIISSVLLVVGLASLLRKSRRALAPLFLVPLLALHIPSLLVLQYPDQVPSASRSLGAAPFVYLIVALGLFELYKLLQKRSPKYATGVVALVLLVSLQSNIDRYFVKYISGMPYNDVPIGREILHFVETLSPDTTIYIVGSQWRDEIPEPMFIQIQMRNPDRLQRFDPTDTLTCEGLATLPRPAVMVWSFDDAIPSPNVRNCADEFRPMLHATKEGVPVFFSAALTGIANPNYVAPAPQAAETPQDEQQPDTDAAGNDTGTVPVPDVAPPIQEVLTVNGIETTVTSSAIDGGSLPDLFDGNNNSMMRGANQNPFDVKVAFATPVQAKTLTFNMAGMKNFVAILKVTSAAGTESYEQSYPTADLDQVVVFDLQQSVAMTAMSISFYEQDVPEFVSVNIHLREIIIAE